MQTYKHIGLGAMKNPARSIEKKRAEIQQTLERLSFFTVGVSDENIEAMAEIISTEIDASVTELLERINKKAAVLNDPFTGRFLLIFTVISLREEIESFEKMLVDLTLKEIASLWQTAIFAQSLSGALLRSDAPLARIYSTARRKE